jgi:hypothetical protein
MSESKKEDVQVISVVLKKLTQQHIPRMQRMLERLNQGEKLSAADINTLKRIYESTGKDTRRIERNPEYKDVAVRYVDLYTTVIKKAMEAEEGG